MLHAGAPIALPERREYAQEWCGIGRFLHPAGCRVGMALFLAWDVSKRILAVGVVPRCPNAQCTGTCALLHSAMWTRGEGA